MKAVLEFIYHNSFFKNKVKEYLKVHVSIIDDFLRGSGVMQG